MGLGVLGTAQGNAALAAAGCTGGLLHVVNHALFKALLFLAAGAVIHATGTRHLEHLGGLLRRMPVTGAAFVLGSIAIVGLPPLNGFVSELVIYVGALQAGMSAGIESAGLLLGCAADLALIGGLASACFAKAFGVVFLGVERRPLSSHVVDPPLAMRVGMYVLGLGCIAIGLLSPAMVRWMTPVVSQATSLSMPESVAAMESLAAMFHPISAVACLGIGLAGGLWLLRSWLLRGRAVRRAPTWDCGFAAPTPRMQYTASSFAQPVLDLFGVLVRSSRDARLPVSVFPGASSFRTHEHDVWREYVFAGLFRRAASLFDRFHWIQQGKVQIYVLYVVVTLIGLLLWKLS